MASSTAQVTVPEIETIRRAAALMRERAERANTDDARRPYADRSYEVVPPERWGALVIDYLGGPIGEHCSTWQPAVAIAVADLLDTFAEGYMTERDVPECSHCADGLCGGHDEEIYHTVCGWAASDNCPCIMPVLALARTYLGIGG